MSRALRIALWSVGLIAVAVGATLFWIESQLRPEPLGVRVKGLLADAGIKGGITRVEASLDGKFSAAPGSGFKAILDPDPDPD